MHANKMGTRIVKTFSQLRLENKLFNLGAIAAQKAALRSGARVNKTISRKIVEKDANFSGSLLNSIEITPINQFNIKVIAMDYGEGSNPEIEEGLQGRQRVWKASTELLDAWREHKSGQVGFEVGIKGRPFVVVGNSAGGLPHPSGLHYMERGINAGFAATVVRLDTELIKLNA